MPGGVAALARQGDILEAMVGARRRIASLLAAAGAISLLGACGSSADHPTSTPTTAAPTTSAPPTTPAPTTTTTTAVPPDPQSSPQNASAAFIDAWEAGDRTAAAKVATATAVATLFAARYGGEVLNDRECSVPGVNAVVCSWGPYAEASPTNPLYEVTVSPHGADWYVSSVTKLG